MNNRVRMSVLACAALAITAPLHARQQPTAAAHLAWMDDASDAQDELREVLTKKDAARSTELAGALEKLMTQTETYWSAKKMPDIVALARQSRELSAAVGAAVKKNDFDAAGKSFEALGAKCNACHDLHPEKR